MSFAEVLRKITDDVKGAKGAVIVGMDGIVVEQYAPQSDLDLPSVGAEYGNILKEVQNASESLRLGSARELAIMTEASDVIIRKINEDYFLALLLTPSTGLGKGRFAARIAAGRLQKEF